MGFSWADGGGGGEAREYPAKDPLPQGPLPAEHPGACKKSKSPCVRLHQLCHLMFNIWEGKYPEAFPNTPGPALQVCGENPRQGRHLTCHGGPCRPRRGPGSPPPLTGGSGRMDFLEAGLPLSPWFLDRQSAEQRPAFSTRAFCSISPGATSPDSSNKSRIAGGTDPPRGSGANAENNYDTGESRRFSFPVTH